MGRLEELWSHGQSPWLDNLRRSWIHDGQLQGWLDRGVRGLTSNPSIFAAAMIESTDYDEQLRELVAGGASVEEAYWGLVEADIKGAAALLRPLHEMSGGEDGYVSVEVSPELAHDEASTIARARELDERIGASNLYVKVPATAAGIPAIETLIAEGLSVNVTLIFGLDRYREVIESYLSGLERYEGDDLSTISSVASFFVSRVDVEVDRRLNDIGTPDALALQGQTAVAQARAAYQVFLDEFSSPRWQALADRGARLQRPLWASTSTKNPEYPDTLYVDSLIGPNTVNTIPDATLHAFEEHGTVARTLDADPDATSQVFDDLESVGIDLGQVADTLEFEGVASFAKAFDDVLGVLRDKTES